MTRQKSRLLVGDCRDAWVKREDEIESQGKLKKKKKKKEQLPSSDSLVSILKSKEFCSVPSMDEKAMDNQHKITLKLTN